MSLWGKNKTKDIDLVLASSGVRAPCFIGAIAALEERNYNIRRIAGSSGGAIIAAGYALGMSMDEMREIAATIPYKQMRDFKIKNFCSLRNPSVYTGQALDKFLQGIYGDATLKDFQIDCKISVVTIIGRNRILVDRESHPDLPVWRAVRMSSTIPFIFPYLDLDGEPVTDGGLVTSMFDIFPGNVRPVIGLRPRADYNLKKTVQDVKAYKLFIWNYIKIIAEYFIDAVDNQHVPQVEWNRTIVIPTFELGGFNFYIGPEQINTLIQYGYNAVMTDELGLLSN
jgi:hypothetical protein